VTSVERSLRKIKVRRRISRSGHRTPKSVAEISAELRRNISVGVEDSQVEETDTATDDGELGDVDIYADTVEDVLPGRIVRRKVHPDVPMSVDDALYQMELVATDFLPVSRQRNRSASSWFIAAEPTIMA